MKLNDTEKEWLEMKKAELARERKRGLDVRLWDSTQFLKIIRKLQK